MAHAHPIEPWPRLEFSYHLGYNASRNMRQEILGAFTMPGWYPVRYRTAEPFLPPYGDWAAAIRFAFNPQVSIGLQTLPGMRGGTASFDVDSMGPRLPRSHRFLLETSLVAALMVHVQTSNGFGVGAGIGQVSARLDDVLPSENTYMNRHNVPAGVLQIRYQHRRGALSGEIALSGWIADARFPKDSYRRIPEARIHLGATYLSIGVGIGVPQEDAYPGSI